MNHKIVLLGLDGSGRSNLLKYLKYGLLEEPSADLEFYDISYNNLSFLMSKSDSATDCSAVIFCLDGSDLESLPAAKKLFDQVCQSQINYWAIIQTKADKQTIDAQELAQFLQVEQLGEKEVMVGSVSSLTGEGTIEMLEWLHSMLHVPAEVVEYEFIAEPRVVKSRAKYSVGQTAAPISKPQQTFHNLMKDKRIRLLDPVQQEQEFLRLEKERIKVENMHTQLNNFKKNKKRMTPYEIKPSPNPRLEVNLEFFLTDSADTIEKITSTIDTQTDVFQQPPSSPAFVTKKTGIDSATQVEDYELFEFDREVTPILDVLVSKSLEQASIEIEQEEELQSMKVFKEAFLRKRADEKDKQKQVLQAEMTLLNNKNAFLKKYIDKEERKQYLIRKAQAYEISSKYLKDLQKNTFTQVINQGLYPNEFVIQLETKFMDWLISKTQAEATKIHNLQTNLFGTFDSNIKAIQEERVQPDAIVRKRRDRMIHKSINRGNTSRVIRMVYWDQKPVPTIIALKLPRHIDGTLEEYERNYDSKIGEMDQRLDSEQITEDDFFNLKRVEFPDMPLNYLGLSIKEIRKLSFRFAHNQFYQTNAQEKKVQIFAMLVEKSGKYTIIDSDNPRFEKLVHYKSNIRVNNAKQSDDIAIVVKTNQLDEEIVCVVLGLRLPNIQANAQQTKYSRFGLADHYYNIPFDQTEISTTVKWEELVKVPDNPDKADLPQTGILICYTLTRRYKNFGKWFAESTKTPSKGLLDDEIPKFYQRTASVIADLHEMSMTMDQHVIVRVAEREAEGLNADPSRIYARKRIQSIHKVQNPNESVINQSVVEPHKSTDEPLEVVRSILYSRVFKELLIGLQDTGENAFIDHFHQHECSLFESLVNGFELLCRNKTFSLPKQLLKVIKIIKIQNKKLYNIGDMVVKAKAEPIVEKLDQTALVNIEELVQDNEQ